MSYLSQLNSVLTLPNPNFSFRCGRNCATCPYISHGLATYTFFSTSETRPIKPNPTCDTKNLIYIIQCNRCNLQYIGERKRRLKDRFNEHRRTIDNPNTKSKPTTAAEHFLSSSNDTANDMQLIPIEKISSNRDSIRKAKEAFLIQKGRTSVKKHFNRFLLLYFVYLLFYFFICLSVIYIVNYFYVFPVICYIKNTSRCKIFHCT